MAARGYIMDAMTYLTVPISAESLDRASRQIREAVSAGAEMLELRTDYLNRLDRDTVAALIAKPNGPFPRPCRAW